MLTFRQVIDAKLETLQPQIDGWQTVSGSLADTKKDADKVAKGIRSGDWKGASEKAADGKAEFLTSQVSAAKTEVDAVKWILWRARKLFNEIQTQLRDIAKQIEQNPYLTVADTGEVRVDTAGTNSLGLRGKQLAANETVRANAFTKQIQELLKQITAMDSDVAKALRAAGHVDNPSDPNFNSNAPKDGNLPLGKYMNDKYKLDNHFPKWAIHKFRGEKRTPQEVLAALNMMATFTYDDANRAHTAADDAASKYFGKLDANLHNGRGDAMKHAMPAAMVSRDAGEGNARLLLDGHERQPNNPTPEEVMDRHNNEIGYRIARVHPNAGNEELARLLSKEVESGHTLSVNEHNDENKKNDNIEFSDGVPNEG